MKPSPLVSEFLKQVASQGEDAALIFKNTSCSYSELDAHANDWVQKFSKNGVVANEGVLVFVPPSPSLYAILIALWKLGAYAVFVDSWTGKNRLESVLASQKIRYFIGIPLAHFLRFKIKTFKMKHCFWVFLPWKFQLSKNSVEPVLLKDSQTALVTFTTGSSGRPKGANRTHQFLMSQHEALLKSIGPPQGNDFTTLPIFVLHHLACGITSVLAPMPLTKPNQFSPKKMLSSFQKYQCKNSASSPQTFLKMAHYLAEKNTTFPDVFHLHLGGAPVFPSTIKKIAQSFPHSQITVVYGSTEAEPMALLEGTELAKHSLTELQNGLPVGKPYENIKLKILNIKTPFQQIHTELEWQKYFCKNLEVGEICVAGDHVLKEYLHAPDAQKEKKIWIDQECWHRTGDLGCLNKDNQLFLLGPLHSLIQWQGLPLFPFIYETQIVEYGVSSRGTLMQHQDQLFMVIEAPVDDEKQQNIARDLNWNFPFQWKVSNLPRDPRHAAKIDYDKLKILLFGKEI